MKTVYRFFPIGHFTISVMFIFCGVSLIVYAGVNFWEGIQPFSGITFTARVNAVLQAIALLTVASASLELGQIILEEEVVRETHLSAPTRVRRFLSRFMVVLVVSLSIEALVLVFRLSHDHPEQLPYAAAIGIMAAALLAGWAVFIHFNRSAEELEPKSMREVQQEDEKLPRSE
jgi:hypothetical protein